MDDAIFRIFNADCWCEIKKVITSHHYYNADKYEEAHLALVRLKSWHILFNYNSLNHLMSPDQD